MHKKGVKPKIASKSSQLIFMNHFRRRTVTQVWISRLGLPTSAQPTCINIAFISDACSAKMCHNWHKSCKRWVYWEDSCLTLAVGQFWLDHWVLAPITERRLSQITWMWVMFILPLLIRLKTFPFFKGCQRIASEISAHEHPFDRIRLCHLGKVSKLRSQFVWKYGDWSRGCVRWQHYPSINGCNLSLIFYL